MSEVQSSLRVDFSGGTLDLWPLYTFMGGAKTINISLSLQTQVSLKYLEDSSPYLVEIPQLQEAYTFKTLEEFLGHPSPNLSLLQESVRALGVVGKFHIVSRSDSPVGSGLAGSSSLLISFLKALAPESKMDLVELAHNIEARVLKTPTGTQDYYPALQAGINLIQYSDHGRQHSLIDPQNFKSWDLAPVIVHSGQAHHSGLNNWDICKAVMGETTGQTLGSLKSLAEVSEKVFKSLVDDNKKLFFKCLSDELELRSHLGDYITPQISQVFQDFKDVGIENYKVCGAGGGGCVVGFVPRAMQKNLIDKLEKKHLVLHCDWKF